eukprot:jgi/Botrbrau1/20818/Bobra.0156s0045.1
MLFVTIWVMVVVQEPTQNNGSLVNLTFNCSMGNAYMDCCVLLVCRVAGQLFARGTEVTLVSPVRHTRHVTKTTCASWANGDATSFAVLPNDGGF